VLDRLYTDDRGGAVVLRAKLDPPIAGGDDEPAARCEDGPGDDAQAIAECAPGREPQQLGRDQGAFDGEEARDLLVRAVDPGPIVLDEVAAVGKLADADVDMRAEVEAIVSQFLEHDAAQPLRRYASL